MKEILFTIVVLALVTLSAHPSLAVAMAGYGRKRRSGGKRRRIEHSNLVFKGGGAPPPPPPPLPPPQFSRQVSFKGKVGGGTQAGGAVPAATQGGTAQASELGLVGDVTNAMAQVGNKKNLGA